MLRFGPFDATVDGLGVEATLTFGSESPNLGFCDLALAFRPPTRVVLVIESDVVNGGGFVEIDPAAGRYAGGLALDAFGVGISAIVVVDTEIAGDPDGWALLRQPRRHVPDAAAARLRLHADRRRRAAGAQPHDRRRRAGRRPPHGAADSILFPEDIEEDAAAVLAGLDLWFPTKSGTTVVGPVVELGWGSPTLISAQLGVVVAIPDLIVTLLGSVEMLLPTEDEALLSLRMDVIGAVDVPAATVIVAASLHDSDLLGVFTLSGDMGFYARLSGQPLFVLSIGGYHPQFDPPGALPAWLLDLRRLTASVPLGLGVEATLRAYVAVTSNSFQFGGRLKIVASVEVLLTTYSAEGWFSVNVLLVLKPFKIVAGASAGVTISAGDRELMGVHLRARIEGPQPWYAMGRASFTFFGLDVPFEFDVGSQPGGEPRDSHDVVSDVVVAVIPPDGWELVETRRLVGHRRRAERRAAGRPVGAARSAGGGAPVGRAAEPDDDGVRRARPGHRPDRRGRRDAGRKAGRLAGVDRGLVRARPVRQAGRHHAALGALVRADDGGRPVRRRGGRRSAPTRPSARRSAASTRSRSGRIPERRKTSPYTSPAKNAAVAARDPHRRGREARDQPDLVHGRAPLGRRARRLRAGRGRVSARA